MSMLAPSSRFPRRRFGRFKREAQSELPHLLQVQQRSYDAFLGENGFSKEESGIAQALGLIFPIESGNGLMKLEYTGEYELEKGRFDIQSCRDHGLTYQAQLRAKLALTVYERGKTGQKRVKYKVVDWVYVCDIPLMTPFCSFVINGTERAVISQLHRSPGVFFEHDRGRNNTGKLLFRARIIPYHGSWVDFEFDTQDRLFFRIDRKKKLPVTILLRSLGMSDRDIIDAFYEHYTFKLNKNGTAKVKMPPETLRGTLLTFDIKDGKDILIKRGTHVTSRHLRLMRQANIDTFAVDTEYMIGKGLAEDVINPETGEILAPLNHPVSKEDLERFLEADVKGINLIYTNEIDFGDYVSKTLRMDHTKTETDAIAEIFQSMRPGDLPSESVARNQFQGLFFDIRRYSLSRVGRMKLNVSTGRQSEGPGELLDKEDFVNVVKTLIAIRDGRRALEDVDSLANRRVRSVGEMLANQLRVGLSRMERNLKDELGILDQEKRYQPKDLVNPKPISMPIREFFISGQMSQFMDQNNPLSEVTHKRRVTALGPGGVSRERSGFEVRDVHATHYGRLCPIETPEGPNIGLINSLAGYADIDHYGFLVTPYYRVKDKQVMDERVNYSVFMEENEVIVQADTPLDDQGRLLEEKVLARINNELELVPAERVTLIEVSPSQVVSIAASLIPFLEHDDANRALMGSNMQRQATPLIRRQAPLVGTGVESVVAKDSGAVILALRGGVVKDVDATRVVVEVNEEERADRGVGVDIYHLTKYLRTNQDTCFNQVPIVSVGQRLQKGDVIADSMSTENGELALGQNIRIAFMSWNGYNYEDSILISEKILRDDLFTSIHIEEMVCYARSTKSGDEEITPEIPGLSETALSKLDESGIIRVGTHVKSGDVLVGKITPKGETQYTPEERLLRAVFGEKSMDVKDTSLRVKPGIKGTVIGVQVYSRNKKNVSKRGERIVESRLSRLARDLEVERGSLSDSYNKLRELLKDKEVLHKGQPLSAKELETLNNQALLELTSKDKAVLKLQDEIKTFERHLDETYAAKRDMVQSTIELPPGILQMVKVFVAVKRKIQPGDKMAGRHGNKGVVSAIMPIEDMPYDASGRPVDIILSPLGVPSRMNVGQIIETHLGAAAVGIAQKIERMLLSEKETQMKEVRAFLKEVYGDRASSLEGLKDDDLVQLARNTKDGLLMATPVFDGASEAEVSELLKLADLPETGKITLYDGRTGEPFDSPITVGYMYIMKLNHLIDDKMHARSAGSYSLVTQQPLGGKSQFGGQRFGEMEVWALEAYGAAYTLQEMLTVKSDDVSGRRDMYAAIVRGEQYQNTGMPESFNVLIREIRSLGLNIDTE